jgi:hypothetical protein
VLLTPQWRHQGGGDVNQLPTALREVSDDALASESGGDGKDVYHTVSKYAAGAGLSWLNRPLRMPAIDGPARPPCSTDDSCSGQGATTPKRPRYNLHATSAATLARHRDPLFIFPSSAGLEHLPRAVNEPALFTSIKQPRTKQPRATLPVLAALYL